MSSSIQYLHTLLFNRPALAARFAGQRLAASALIALLSLGVGACTGQAADQDGSTTGSPDVRYYVWVQGDRESTDTINLMHWQNPGVYPYLQIIAGRPDSNYKFPPGMVAPSNTTAFDSQRNSWGGKNPEIVGHNLMAWARWWQTSLGDRGRDDFEYLFNLNQWGAPSWPTGTDYRNNNRNLWALGTNWFDRLTEPGLPSDEVRVGSFYAENGIILNSEWSRRFFESAELNRARFGLPAPAGLIPDFEWNFHLWTKARDWWAPALRDPRSWNVLIDGQLTMQQHDAQAPPLQLGQGLWHPTNRPFTTWLYTMYQRCEEHALWEAYWKHGQSQWPGIALSNYRIVESDASMPYPLPHHNMYLPAYDLRHATHLSPRLYPFEDKSLDGPATQQVTRFSGTPTGSGVIDRRMANVLFLKAQIDACVATGKPVIPWIAWPAFDPRGAQDGKMSQSDIVEVMQYGVSKGVKQWILWHDDIDYDWNPIVSAVNSYAATLAAATAGNGGGDTSGQGSGGGSDDGDDTVASNDESGDGNDDSGSSPPEDGGNEPTGVAPGGSIAKYEHFGVLQIGRKSSGDERGEEGLTGQSRQQAATRHLNAIKSKKTTISTPWIYSQSARSINPRSAKPVYRMSRSAFSKGDARKALASVSPNSRSSIEE